MKYLAFLVLYSIVLTTFCIHKVGAANYFPPRIQQICSDNYIGHEYNPKLEKRCRVLWNAWTKDMLQVARDGGV